MAKEEAAAAASASASQQGPDLNESKPPLDKKLYRQILLPNGLRVVLVSDTIAMNHQDLYANDSDDDDDDDDKESDSVENEKANDSEDLGESDDPNENETGSGDERQDGEEEDDDDDEDGLRDAAAAMVVGVGSMYDPPEAQGLAHFLEHMLFMGTKKYPGENAYDAFLSKHGGSDNAYTEIEYTVYYLSIPQEKLFPALDMFAQFFIHPLMKEDAVERELKSIESEFQLSKNSDSCRLQQLMCHTSGYTPQEHVFSKFAWGNLKSLKDEPAAAGVDMMKLLRDFYDQYYYATNMRLVVIGAYTLDELQRKVEAKFAEIPSGPRVATAPLSIRYDQAGTWNQTLDLQVAQNPLPMTQSSLSKIYRIIPVRDRHSLSITFQIPSQIPNWRSKPCDYLAHLLGHESKGSILAALKKKSWVTGCFAGVGSEGVEYASSHALFTVSFSLSEEGVNHWEEIIEYMFSYVGMLRYLCQNDKLPEWIQEELRLTHEVSYRFRDDESPEDFVETFADRLAPHYQFPPERLLDVRDLMFDYDEGLIQTLLDKYFIPSNARVDLMSTNFGREAEYSGGGEDGGAVKSEKQLVADKTFDPQTAGTPLEEPYFGTHYWCHDISSSTIDQWTTAAQPQLPPPDFLLALPPKNPFVPESLDLKPLPEDDSDHPLLNSSIKLCVTVGKRKSWFPATVVQYNGMTNQILLSYEDEEKKWHLIDQQASEMTTLSPGFEGSLDKKAIKFRLVSLARLGSGAILKYGDDSDFEVLDGLSFPAIPPKMSESRLPRLVCNRKELKLWHLQDRKFKRPIAELRLRLVCAAGSAKTALHQACSDLMIKLCADAVTETSYLASVCELDSSIATDDVGFYLRVHGFDDKLLTLCNLILSVLLSFRTCSDGLLPETVEEGRFEACREILARAYENSGMQASALSSSLRVKCLIRGNWSSHAKSKALDGITPSTFVTAISEVLKSMTVEAFYHGNVNTSDAKAAENVILSALELSGGAGLSKEQFPVVQITKIPSSREAQFVICPTKNATDANTAVQIYFQIGKDDIADKVMTDLLTHMMAEPLYDQLRTKDQFGYSVSCDARWTCGIMGIYFVVVSSVKSADEITKRIDSFLVDYRKELEAMTQEQFMEHLVGLAKNKLEMFNSLSAECSCYWSEISDRRYDWEVHRNEALALRSCTKESALLAFDEWLLPTTPNGAPRERRGLVVQVIGSGEEASSLGRPSTDDIPAYNDDQIRAFYERIGDETWGKVY